ncbi:MAG: hypothetical protein WAO55_03230 [Candidatus Manganitrophaceae bacterium]
MKTFCFYRPYFIPALLFLGILSLTLPGCGPSAESPGGGPAGEGFGSPENFSVPLPARLQKHLTSNLTAEVIVDGGGPIPLTVDIPGKRVTGTLGNLAPGNHTFEIRYAMNGIPVATGAASATITAGQNTAVTITSLRYPDSDGDGFTNLAELEIFGFTSVAWNDRNSRPAAEIPRSSANYVMTDVIGTSPTVGTSTSVNYSFTGM